MKSNRTWIIIAGVLLVGLLIVLFNSSNDPLKGTWVSESSFGSLPRQFSIIEKDGNYVFKWGDAEHPITRLKGGEQGSLTFYTFEIEFTSGAYGTGIYEKTGEARLTISAFGEARTYKKGGLFK